MKMFKNALLLLAVVSVSILASCGGDTPTASETEQEKAIEAITTGSWSVAVDAANVTGAPDLSNTTVAFSGSAASLSFTLSGTITDYLSGGTLSISEDGVLDGSAATPVGERSASISSAAFTNTEYTAASVVVEVTEADARVSGIGTYTLTFTKQ